MRMLPKLRVMKVIRMFDRKENRAETFLFRP